MVSKAPRREWRQRGSTCLTSRLPPSAGLGDARRQQFRSCFVSMSRLPASNEGPLGGAPRGTQRRREEAMNRFTRIAPAWPRAALALTLALAATCAHAQTSIRLFVGSPAGGAIDIYARTISDHMS